MESDMLNVKVERIGGVTVARLGKVDLETTREFSDWLQEIASEVNTLVIDVSGVRALSSMGVAALGETHLLLKNRDGFLALCGASPAVSRLLRLGGLEKELHLYPTVEDGLAHDVPRQGAGQSHGGVS